jgi:hypothetical protein
VGKIKNEHLLNADALFLYMPAKKRPFKSAARFCTGARTGFFLKAQQQNGTPPQSDGVPGGCF